jgi:hypothetical protein
LAASRCAQINKDEFLNALDHMVAKPAPKKRKNSMVLRRMWTWKKVAPELEPEVEAVEEAAAPAPEPAKKSALEELGDLYMPTPEEKKAEYLAKLNKLSEEKQAWHVRVGRKNPWGAEGDDQLSDAMAYARTIGLTPLLIDNSPKQAIDSKFESDERAVVLNARQMHEEHKKGERSKEELFKDARKQLVLAMKQGKTFYVELKDKITDMTSDGYTSADHLPLGMFDQREVTKLSAYFAGAANQVGNDLDKVSHGLWEADHPLAKVLRPGDLDYDGNFIVGGDFCVVVCTQIKAAEVREKLSTSLPLMRFQPIITE